MKAVIQAGGKGTRLEPYTLVLPKPMMPVGDRPVIEVLLRWIRRNGVTETFITTGYLAHLLKTFCGDGSKYDMSIEYCHEPEPLGTIGAIRLIENHLDDTFLVLNGDLITDLALPDLIKSHHASQSPLTIATTTATSYVDYGVIETEDQRVTSFLEKPTHEFLVSMGIYVMDPTIIDYIPKNVPYGFDNLMHALLQKDIPINTYQHNGQWLDIGRVEDFAKAQGSEWDHIHQGIMQGI